MASEYTDQLINRIILRGRPSSKPVTFQLLRLDETDDELNEKFGCVICRFCDIPLKNYATYNTHLRRCKGKIADTEKDESRAGDHEALQKSV